MPHGIRRDRPLRSSFHTPADQPHEAGNRQRAPRPSIRTTAIAPQCLNGQLLLPVRTRCVQPAPSCSLSKSSFAPGRQRNTIPIAAELRLGSVQLVLSAMLGKRTADKILFVIRTEESKCMTSTNEMQHRATRRNRRRYSFWLGGVRPGFSLWVRRLLLLLWAALFIAILPTLIGLVARAASLGPGVARNQEIALLVEVLGISVVGPALVYLIVGYGISPSAVFWRSQAGLPPPPQGNLPMESQGRGKRKRAS